MILGFLLATIEIQNPQPGDYRLEWWDTYEGKIILVEEVSFTGGLLRIQVPSFRRDITCKVRRMEE